MLNNRRNKMKGHTKKSNVKKHRGNPHGNPPDSNTKTKIKQNQDDSLRQEGVSESNRLKQ